MELAEKPLESQLAIKYIEKLEKFPPNWKTLTVVPLS